MKRENTLPSMDDVLKRMLSTAPHKHADQQKPRDKKKKPAKKRASSKPI
jgi:hypothetical protein